MLWAWLSMRGFLVDTKLLAMVSMVIFLRPSLNQSSKYWGIICECNWMNNNRIINNTALPLILVFETFCRLAHNWPSNWFLSMTLKVALPQSCYSSQAVVFSFTALITNCNYAVIFAIVYFLHWSSTRSRKVLFCFLLHFASALHSDWDQVGTQ